MTNRPRNDQDTDAIVRRYAVPFAQALATFVKALAEEESAESNVQHSPHRDTHDDVVESTFTVEKVSSTARPVLYERAAQDFSENQQLMRQGSATVVEFDNAKPAKAAGNRLKQLLKQRGIKQTQLAERLDVAPSVVSRILKHPERSRLETIRSLADAAGIPLAELF